MHLGRQSTCAPPTYLANHQRKESVTSWSNKWNWVQVHVSLAFTLIPFTVHYGFHVSEWGRKQTFFPTVYPTVYPTPLACPGSALQHQLLFSSVFYSSKYNKWLKKIKERKNASRIDGQLFNIHSNAKLVIKNIWWVTGITFAENKCRLS